MKTLRAIGTALLWWGPWGIFLVAVVDSAGLPILEGVDVLLILIGARNGARAAYFAAALAVAGSVIGSLFLFYIGRKGGEAYLDKRTQNGWPNRLRRWFHHYGLLTVFILALVPVPLPMKIPVLCSGALDIDRKRFILALLAARIPRYFTLAYLGSQLGTYPLLYVKGHIWEWLGGAVGLFLFLLFLLKLKDRLHQRAEQS